MMDTIYTDLDGILDILSDFYNVSCAMAIGMLNSGSYHNDLIIVKNGINNYKIQFI